MQDEKENKHSDDLPNFSKLPVCWAMGFSSPEIAKRFKKVNERIRLSPLSEEKDSQNPDENQKPVLKESRKNEGINLCQNCHHQVQEYLQSDHLTLSARQLFRSIFGFGRKPSPNTAQSQHSRPKWFRLSTLSRLYPRSKTSTD